MGRPAKPQPYVWKSVAVKLGDQTCDGYAMTSAVMPRNVATHIHWAVYKANALRVAIALNGQVFGYAQTLPLGKQAVERIARNMAQQPAGG